MSCTQGEKVPEGRMRGYLTMAACEKAPSPGLSPNSSVMTRLCDEPCTLPNELGERGQLGAVQLVMQQSFQNPQAELRNRK